MNANAMKVKKTDTDTLRPEYDFSKAVRGKYLSRYQQSSNVVVLDTDIATRFKNARAVNEALRALVAMAQLVPAQQSAPADVSASASLRQKRG